MATSSTNAYELATEGYALKNLLKYGEALIYFRRVLDIRLLHIDIEPKSSTLDIAAAHLNIAITLGEINRQEGTDNFQDKALSTAEIASHLLKAARIHKDTLGAACVVTQENLRLLKMVGYEISKDGYALMKLLRYGEALICFRRVLDIRLLHIDIDPRSSTLDIATAQLNIAFTLGEINRQEGTDNFQDKPLRRAEIANHLLKAARIYKNTLGPASDVTQESWRLFGTVPLWDNLRDTCDVTQQT